MRIFIFVAILSLAVSAFGQSPSASVGATQSKDYKVSPGLAKAFGNYGLWWTSLSDEAKGSFIQGYLSAMGRAESVADGFCKDARSKLQPGPSFDKEMSSIMTICLLSQEFSFDQQKGFKTFLDEFYADPLNARIPDSFAMGYSRDRIMERKSTGQLLDELNAWRKILNHK